MIPLTEFQHECLMAFLPRVLGGITYPLIETQRNIPRPECPAIVVWASSETPSDGANSLLRTFRNRDGEMVEFWGERYFFTLNCSLRAYDPAELATMHRSFLRQVQHNRRAMKMRMHTIEFKEVLRSESLAMDSQRESYEGQQVFRAIVELRFEFEVSERDYTDLIKKYYHDVWSGERDAKSYQHQYTGECRTVELTYAINASIEAKAVESTYAINAVIEGE